MATSIPVPSSDETITLEEFLQKCDKQLNPADELSIASMGSSLAALARNKAEFSAFFNAQLLDVLENNKSLQGGRNTEQTFILAKGEKYTVRLALWGVAKARGGSTQWDNAFYVYELAHNHRFSLLTVGLHGPGYITENYSIDIAPQILTPGSIADIARHPDQQLHEGTVLLYRKWHDIHIQHPPKEFSMSLNLIVEDISIPQYLFDVDKSRVGNQISGPYCDLSNILRISDAYAPSLKQSVAHTLGVSPSIRGTYLEERLKLDC